MRRRRSWRKYLYWYLYLYFSNTNTNTNTNKYIIRNVFKCFISF